MKRAGITHRIIMNSRRAAMMLLVVMMAWPIVGHAQEAITGQDGDWKYTYSGGVTKLTGYTGTATHVTTPTKVGGFMVTRIATTCFSNHQTSLESVTVSEGVVWIDSRTFQDYTSLTTVSLPSTLKELEEYTFYGCTSLTTVSFPSNSALATIGGYAFLNCTSLTTVSLPSNNALTTIEDGAFYTCTSLTTISLPNTLTELGAGAFCECTSLPTISLPSQIIHVEQSTFYGCINLASVTFQGPVTTIDKDAFGGCQALTSITLPSSISSIGASAFFGTGLRAVWFEGKKTQWENVTKGTGAFPGNVTFHWRCTATFDMWGHGAAPAAQTVYSNVANALTKPTAPEAQGYEFFGWYIIVDNKIRYFDFAAPLDDDVTIYADWVPYYNTISFDLGGKGTSIERLRIKSGGVVIEPAVQLVNGEYIEGWYTDANYFQRYDFNTPVDHSMTLYAKWAQAGRATFNVSGEVGNTVELINYRMNPLLVLNADGWFIPGEYTLTVEPESGYSFSGSYTLKTRGDNITPFAPKSISGGNQKTYTIDLTEKDVDIDIVFNTTPIVTIDVTYDGSGAAGAYTLTDNQSDPINYTNGDELQHVYDGTSEYWNSNYDLTLSVIKVNTFGCAATIVNNGTVTRYNDVDVLPGVRFIPKGGIDIELFFYDKSTGIVTLLNDDSNPEVSKNTDILTTNDGQKHMVKLSGRTLYRDGDWNTLCLPFNFNIEGSELDKSGVEQLMELDTETPHNGHVTGFEDGTLYLNFKDAGTTIMAGRPYIIKWKKPTNYNNNPSNYDIANPMFNSVTLSKDAPFSITSTDGKVRFVGNYAYQAFTAEDRSILFLGEGNQLYYPEVGATLGAFRASFVLNGIEAGEPNNIRLFFGGSEEDTGITTTNFTNSTNLDNAWYTLDGRRLSGQPSQRGIYIHGGRKEVVKESRGQVFDSSCNK